jgi:hypothetical protein
MPIMQRKKSGASWTSCNAEEKRIDKEKKGMSDKHLRLSQLVAVCVKKQKTPSKVGFADFIHQLCASYYGVDKRTRREYLDTLIQSWNFEKWRTLVQSNGYLSKEEKEAWTRQF